MGCLLGLLIQDVIVGVSNKRPVISVEKHLVWNLRKPRAVLKSLLKARLNVLGIFSLLLDPTGQHLSTFSFELYFGVFKLYNRDRERYSFKIRFVQQIYLHHKITGCRFEFLFLQKCTVYVYLIQLQKNYLFVRLTASKSKYEQVPMRICAGNVLSIW